LRLRPVAAYVLDESRRAMDDQQKTKAELLTDITALRTRVAELEQARRNGSAGVFVPYEIKTDDGLNASLLFEHHPMAMWIYDVETLAFLAVNDAAIQQYDYSREEFLSMTIRDIRPAEELPRLLDRLESLPVGPRNVSHDWKHRTKSGALIYVDVISYAVKFGGRLAKLILANDVTERQRAEQEILRLNRELERRVDDRTAQLEAANKELEAFSYSVSHDLRAPLRHIDGFSRLLAQREAARLDETSGRYLSIISDAARRMGQLIDDLLAFSRMGRAEMRALPVDLEHLVADVHHELAPACEGRSIDWVIGMLPIVRGDAAMLRIVLTNLLSNAIKYTAPRPAAHISITASADDDAWQIAIADNGVGFDMQYAHKLFGVFQRLHRDEEFEGTGIGLATVRRIIDRHGGRVWAQGEIGAGATFFFTLAPYAQE
jgi:PAS domain S-box-containing protein